MILEALGNGKFSLLAQGIDKPITIMADEVFEVRAIGKQLYLLLAARLRCGRRRTLRHNALATESAGVPVDDRPLHVEVPVEGDPAMLAPQ